MRAWPNTTVSILRGTTTNDYGDVLDADTVVHTGIPASIIEQFQSVRTADFASPQIVRTITGRVVAGTDVTDSDRVKDERTGRVYIVNAISQPENQSYNSPDLNLQLERIE